MLPRIHVLTLLLALYCAPGPCHARGSWGPQHPALESARRPAPPGDYERALPSAGGTRYYELHVPPHAGREPLPVVLNFHGGMGNAQAARRGTGMDHKADRENFLVVYPQGLGAFPRRFLTWNGGICCGRAQRENADDVGFVRAILDDLPRYVKIDERRIYATGFSNGAIMSHRLGCELSERIAAIATVSGTIGVSPCRPARPVPVLHIHGTADENCPYRGGAGAHSLSGSDFRSVPDTVATWRAANRAAAVAQVTRKGAVKTERWPPGPSGAEVVLVTIEGQGHVWPGGDAILPAHMVGHDVGALEATDLIWDFFRKRAPGKP